MVELHVMNQIGNKCTMLPAVYLDSINQYNEKPKRLNTDVEITDK